MSKRDVSLYIVDIFIAYNKIKRYTVRFDNSQDFKWSELEWDATLRELEIIGEATNSLIRNNILDNKNYRKIVDFRNIIIHGYFGIDEDEVWQVVSHNLDIFYGELMQIVIENNIYIKDAIKHAKKENIRNDELIEFLDSLK